MAIKALDLSATINYVHPGDEGDDATVFHLATLSSRDIGRINDATTSFSFSAKDMDEDGDGNVSTSLAQSKRNFEAVRLALTGWENFIGPDDKPVAFETIKRDVGGRTRDVVKPELLDMIPLAVVNGMAARVLSANQLSADDLGN